MPRTKKTAVQLSKPAQEYLDRLQDVLNELDALGDLHNELSEEEMHLTGAAVWGAYTPVRKLDNVGGGFGNSTVVQGLIQAMVKAGGNNPQVPSLADLFGGLRDA